MSNRMLTKDQLQGLIAAPEQVPKATIVAGGQTFKPSQVAGLAKIIMAALATETEAKGKLANARQATAAARATNEPTLKEIRTTMAGMFSNDAATLTALGLSPRKARKPVDAEARILATAKSNATRLARGTKGKKQKLAFTGNVASVVVTPVTMGVVSPSGTSAAAAQAGTSAAATQAAPAAAAQAAQAPAATPVANGVVALGAPVGGLVNGASH